MNEKVPVPVWGIETHTWVPQNTEMLSRRAQLRNRGKYSSSIPTTIAELQIQLPGSLAAAVAEAEAKLAEFNSYAKTALGDSPHSLGALSSVLLRSESASSSQIENLTVGVRQLALAELGIADAPNAHLVQGNVRAMRAAIAAQEEVQQQAESQPLFERILRCHGLLLQDSGYPQELVGRLREDPVWIGAPGSSPVTADYVAPQAALLPAALADLVSFIERNDLPLLVHLAIAHAQFENIHPFTDGNGRTGRALIHIHMQKLGLTGLPVPLSNGFLAQQTAYYAALESYRSGDAAAIIRVFCDAAFYAARWGYELVSALVDLLEELRGRLLGVREHSSAKRALPFLFAFPILNSAVLARELGITQQAAVRAISTLADRGVLREISGKRNHRLWVQDAVLELLGEHAARVLRPQI